MVDFDFLLTGNVEQRGIRNIQRVARRAFAAAFAAAPAARTTSARGRSGPHRHLAEPGVETRAHPRGRRRGLPDSKARPPVRYRARPPPFEELRLPSCTYTRSIRIC